jgi:GR25 family glycosyltransferase involved in LPS biosynthesis
MIFETYVMHYSPLRERFDHFMNELNKVHIHDPQIMMCNDRENMDPKKVSLYKRHDIDAFNKAALTSLKKIGLDSTPKFVLNDSEISLTIKHLDALDHFVECDNAAFALMLEDDFMFMCNDIDLTEIVLGAPEDWDVIFLGGGLNLDFLSVQKILPGNPSYLLVNHPSTNTTSSMIYSMSAARRVLKAYHADGFVLPLDWQLNYFFEKLDFNVYHTNPRICGQLSNRRFRSAIK